jgi:phosphatidylinositol dimannoside acyltransferase
VLTIPDPQNGRRLEFEMRKRTGMNLVPASISGMKQARNQLASGGVVLTGIDRPVVDANVRPCFFGHPASLPVHHIYLAMKASVPVMIVAARTGKDGRYQVTTSEPIEMESTSDRDKDIVRNAERVLKEAEHFILREPEQWSISLPVWPELGDCVPD